MTTDPSMQPPIDPVFEKLYNVRAAVPDHLAIFERWRAWSDAYAADRADAQLDLAYGDGAGETLDFFPALPGGDAVDPGRAPLVMLIHGGYWQAMDRRDNRFAARALCNAGAAVAVVNHTLCPATTLAGIAREMRRAARWLADNPLNLAYDARRMSVIGHSAGGHLAALLLCADGENGAEHGADGIFRGGVAISGLFDLEPLVATTINAKVGLTADQARVLSPVAHVPQDAPRFLAAVGGDESAGFHDQAARLQTAWAAHGAPVETLTLPGCHHFQAFEALADPGSALFRAAAPIVGVSV